MTADSRLLPFQLLLEFERERSRLCRAALHAATSAHAARAWAAAVQDADRRVHQLAAACRELGSDPVPAVEESPVHAFAAAMVAELDRALAGASQPKLAASALHCAAPDAWELRVG